MTRAVDEWPACAECGFVPRLGSVSMSLPADHPYWREARQHDERYRVHVAHETRALLSTTPLSALECRLVAPIRKQFGSWVVSHYGVECLTTPYTISKRRLNESWLEHMSEKLWVIIEDFALEPHTDVPPVGRKFAMILGVAFSRWSWENGTLRVWERGIESMPHAVVLEPGDVVMLDPDLPHSPGVNRSGEIRTGMYVRFLKPL